MPSPPLHPAPANRSKRNSPIARRQRTDGDETRAAILEAAGRLFGEGERAAVTSKSICESASVNMAAINYHFGGRDGLYQAVLTEAHRRFMSLDFMRELSTSALPPDRQLASFLEELARRVQDDSGWAVRVWAREIVTPTPAMALMLQQEARPKFEVLADIVAEIVGLQPGDRRMPGVVLSVIAPFLVMLLVGRDTPSPIQPLFAQPPADLAAEWSRFALAGLNALRTHPLHGAG